MIAGETLTASEAVKKYGIQALLGRQCVVVTSIIGNDVEDVRIGEIVDPGDCAIDELDGARLYVEYHKNDDFYLASVYEDAPIVLLSEVVE